MPSPHLFEPSDDDISKTLVNYMGHKITNQLVSHYLAKSSPRPQDSDVPTINLFNAHRILYQKAHNIHQHPLLARTNVNLLQTVLYVQPKFSWSQPSHNSSAVSHRATISTTKSKTHKNKLVITKSWDKISIPNHPAVSINNQINVLPRFPSYQQTVEVFQNLKQFYLSNRKSFKNILANPEAITSEVGNNDEKSADADFIAHYNTLSHLPQWPNLPYGLYPIANSARKRNSSPIIIQPSVDYYIIIDFECTCIETPANVPENNCNSNIHNNDGNPEDSVEEEKTLNDHDPYVPLSSSPTLIDLNLPTPIKQGNLQPENTIKHNFIHEIIEFPAILIDAKNFTVVSIFHTYVRPTINPILSEFCINLTHITQEQVDVSPPIDIATILFTQWLLSYGIVFNSHTLQFIQAMSIPPPPPPIMSQNLPQIDPITTSSLSQPSQPQDTPKSTLSQHEQDFIDNMFLPHLQYDPELDSILTLGHQAPFQNETDRHSHCQSYYKLFEYYHFLHNHHSNKHTHIPPLQHQMLWADTFLENQTSDYLISGNYPTKSPKEIKYQYYTHSLHFMSQLLQTYHKSLISSQYLDEESLSSNKKTQFTHNPTLNEIFNDIYSHHKSVESTTIISSEIVPHTAYSSNEFCGVDGNQDIARIKPHVALLVSDTSNDFLNFLIPELKLKGFEWMLVYLFGINTLIDRNQTQDNVDAAQQPHRVDGDGNLTLSSQEVQHCTQNKSLFQQENEKNLNFLQQYIKKNSSPFFEKFNETYIYTSELYYCDARKLLYSCSYSSTSSARIPLPSKDMPIYQFPPLLSPTEKSLAPSPMFTTLSRLHNITHNVQEKNLADDGESNNNPHHPSMFTYRFGTNSLVPFRFFVGKYVGGGLPHFLKVLNMHFLGHLHSGINDSINIYRLLFHLACLSDLPSIPFTAAGHII